jgi:signal transduction histidine kinase/CheY-like chemotaxis protein
LNRTTSPYAGWRVSLVSVLACAGLAWLAVPWAGAPAAYLVFTVAVIVTACYSGAGWGLAVTVLAAASVMPSLATAPVPPAQWVLLAVFLCVGGGLSFFVASQRGARPAGGPIADHQRLQEELEEARRREGEACQDADRLREDARLKEAFLATVAHELRTPLSAMLGWAHVLRDEKVDEATSTRALEAILRNARVQTRLISDLMDVSRIVAGTLRLETQVIEPIAVIRAALETVRPAAEARRITITSNVDAEAGPVVGDAARLQQVLWNLLSNSIKFTPEGGAISVRAQVADGAVQVTVEDTGPGIPPAFLPHVFERFRQAGGTATPSKGGLGLGLAIARTVVELHEGSIVAANRDPGPGAVFTVRLPIKALRPGEARPAPTPLLTESADSTSRLPSLDGVAVLVMDLEEGREMVTTILRKHGAAVVGASSPEEGLAAVTGQRPDVLLLDLDLADADEDSMIRRIRGLRGEEGGATPAVALASFGAGDRTRALLAGFQLQLTKPVRPAELVAAVASLSGRTRQRAEAQEASA